MSFAELHSTDPITNVSGHIDGYDNGYLVGWAWAPEDENHVVELDVFIGKKLVARTEANILRSDLRESGTGTGKYGFRVSLRQVVENDVVQIVKVLDRATGILIDELEITESVFAESSIEKLTVGGITGYVEILDPVELAENDGKITPLEIADTDKNKKKEKETIDSLEVQVLIDGEVSASGEALVNENTGLYHFTIPLPVSVYDNNYHFYSVEVIGKNTKCEWEFERFSDVTTNWEYINKDAHKGILSAIPKISGYRYTALRDQLKANVEKGVAADVAAQLTLVHELVVQGPENRQTYPKLIFPMVDQPIVSIVIPVHNQFNATYHCLASLLLAYSSTSFEVILVDDLSTDKTTDVEEIVENIKVVRNKENLGFLQSIETGVVSARGEYLVLLNNDTEVTSGWLDSMLSTFEQFDSVGLVGSKLVYPDGVLQEAGGIVWNNGKPWNYGNRENSDDPRFNYTRQADFLSGASLMMAKSVWDEVGGFSEEYIPAYYEDTDIAFKVREAGYKTFYSHDSVVIHYEGQSNGTDLNSGIKRFQNVNAPKFRSKWRSAYKHHGKFGVKASLEADRNIDFRVLMIDNQFPTPDCDAGSYAVSQEIRLLQELGCKVTFVPNNMAHLGNYTKNLQKSGVECIYRPFYKDVGDFIRKRGGEFDLVYVVRYDIAEEVIDDIRENSDAKILFNNSDLHFLREIRAALQNGSEEDLELSKETRTRELKVMENVDAILSYNELEHSIITSLNLKSDNIFTCPWVRSSVPSKTPLEKRNGIAFLGGFSHLPNREAVLYFVEDIMPILRKEIPNLTFHVYGSKITDEIKSLACDDVIIEGFVENVSDIFEICRVFVAPLKSGAGLKGKVIESIAHGVPCVLSPIAAESTGVVDGLSAFIADSPDKWVESIKNLYTSDDTWIDMSNAALELLDKKYSQDQGLEKMKRVLSYLELDPQKDKMSYFKTQLENEG